MEKRKVKIWYRQFDDDGNIIGEGCYHKEYCNYGNALRIASKVYGDKKHISYMIGILNPFVEHFEDAECDICGKSYSRYIDAHFGHAYSAHNFYIHSLGAIPTENGRKRFSKHYNTCPDCIVKIKNFIDTLKEGKDDDQ